jgi:hypothetical protein
MSTTVIMIAEAAGGVALVGTSEGCCRRTVPPDRRMALNQQTLFAQ